MYIYIYIYIYGACIHTSFILSSKNKVCHSIRDKLSLAGTTVKTVFCSSIQATCSHYNHNNCFANTAIQTMSLLS